MADCRLWKNKMSKQAKIDQQFRHIRISDRVSKKSESAVEKESTAEPVRQVEAKPECKTYFMLSHGTESPWYLFTCLGKISEDEYKILRDFDHNSEFGPCIGKLCDFPSLDHSIDTRS
jgi:hypothetical protein